MSPVASTCVSQARDAATLKWLDQQAFLLRRVKEQFEQQLAKFRLVGSAQGCRHSAWAKACTRVVLSKVLRPQPGPHSAQAALGTMAVSCLVRMHRRACCLRLQVGSYMREPGPRCEGLDTRCHAPTPSGGRTNLRNLVSAQVPSCITAHYSSHRLPRCLSSHSHLPGMSRHWTLMLAHCCTRARAEA